MKIKSVSGVTLSVKNLKKTAAFYEALGFEIRKREADHISAYSNWFWIDLIAAGKDSRAVQADKDSPKNGNGVLLYLSVDDVDGFHKYLTSRKIKPATKPQDQPWGNREFIVRDPDGYNLVLFKRK